ncbi:MAG: hypothetical protein MR516_08470 [Bacteroidales bacterium]|nr:hypothetical protein [Bacteroidales bacterium]
MEKRDAWEKVTPSWKKISTAACEFFLPNSPRGPSTRGLLRAAAGCGLMQQGDGQAGREQQMAGETNYDAGGGQPLQRKKYHVVRKKNHVVRKNFYVASIGSGE